MRRVKKMKSKPISIIKYSNYYETLNEIYLRKLYLNIVYYRKVNKKDFVGTLNDYKKLIDCDDKNCVFLKSLTKSKILYKVKKSKIDTQYGCNVNELYDLLLENKLFILDYLIVDNEVSILRPPLFDVEKMEQFKKTLNLYNQDENKTKE